MRLPEECIQAEDIGCESRRVKHCEMDDAIFSMQETIGRLSQLLGRITDREETCDPECGRTSASLVDILTAGPERIRKQVNESVDLIDEIEKNLF